MQFDYNYEHSFTLAILALTMPTFHFQGFEFAFSLFGSSLMAKVTTIWSTFSGLNQLLNYNISSNDERITF